MRGSWSLTFGGMMVSRRWLMMVSMLCISLLGWGPLYADTALAVVLEDFTRLDADGFPEGWNGQRSKVTAMDAYAVHQEDGSAFLKGKGANQRVYTKNIQWNPKTPI